MNFKEYNFDEKIEKQLLSITSQNRLPHAIIITGGDSSLRDKLCGFLCKFAVCSDENSPCNKCRNCEKAEALSHPDISYIKGSTKTKNQIYNKDIIEELIRDTAIIPNEASTKVYVLKDVDEKLPVISQNAFLKTLEEPPQDIVFIMTCKDASLLLETILSRCTTVNISGSEQFTDEAVALANSIAEAMVELSEYPLLREVNKLNKRESFLMVIPPLKLIFRDVLVMSTGGNALGNIEIAKKLNRKLTAEKALSLLNTVEKAQNMINSNVNINLLCTWLCTEFRRNIWQK